MHTSPRDARAMLTGDVRCIALRIAAPSLAAMLATGTGTLLDALYLSAQGSEVSAAVSVCFPLLTAQQTVGFTLGMGAGSHMGRKLGEGDVQSACHCAAGALLLAAVLGLALCGAGLLFLHPLLGLLGAGPKVLSEALPYARALLVSTPFACTGLVMGSLLRAQGKTPANMLACIACSALGAALGYLLIVRRGMGARGAGVSLLAREISGCILLAWFFLRAKGFVRPTLRDVTLKPWIFPAILKSGLPTLLRQGVSSVSGLLLSRAGARLGPDVLAGMGLAVRAGALISSAAIGFGQGFSPVCAINHGAGQHERVQSAYRFCMRVMVIALAGAGALVFWLAGPLLSRFNAQPQVAKIAVRALRAHSAVFFAQGAIILMNMRTQATGQTLRASLVAISRQGLFFIPLLLVLARLYGETGLILCQSIADVLALGFSALVMRGVDRTKASH